MKVFRVASDGACLGEISLINLHKLYEVKDLVEKKVQTVTGISLRRFAIIKLESVVRTKKGYKTERIRDVYADWVTGSLYEQDGTCLSSPKLRLIETDEKPHCKIKEQMENFKFGYGADYEYGSN